RGTQGSCAGVHSVEYYTGETIPELNCKTFTVPKRVSLLDSRIGWEPLQYGDPQGNGSGFADEQVHQPTAGKWTLLIFGRHTSNYEGSVSFDETAQTFHNVKGAVKPAFRVVAAGKKATFTVAVPSPAKPGLFTGAVVFHSNRQSA